MRDEPRPIVSATGDARGLVKHAWHVAAEVAGFVITVDPARRLTLAGRVAASDPYLLTQTPLVFVIPTRKGPMRWPIEALTVAEGHVTARLGALLE
jgi:hypothetical protein